MQVIKLTNETTLKHIATSGIGTLILTVIIAFAIPSLGTVQLNLYTAAAIVAGSGIAAVATTPLMGKWYIIGFLGSSTAVGATAIIYLVLGQPMGSLIGVLAVGAFVANLASKYIHYRAALK